MANKRISELAVRTPQTSDLMLIGDPATGYSYKTTILDAINLGVPTTRTLTINGTTYDLSANRTWSVGTVTSVGLTMPSAFNVASSPVTGSGTIAVTAAGLASQYIRGDGTLADFPGGGGGGGASVSYYLNGSVNQGTIGGVTYYEMNKTPILGAGTNFTTSSNGYIASFITDAGDPALLKIPGGNWNTEFYFAASSGGGTPTYYIELYKYDGTTFTLIASSSTNPDTITGGTSVEQYFTTIPVPETVLTATDRLAIRIYVTTAGRTITLHTENSNLCQIITTFTTGLTALNGLTAQVQYFATGSAGTDFNISSSTATHTFNLPTASATNRGALSSADWTTFNNKVTSIIAGNAITVSNASGNVTVNHADTSGADPGATITGSNVFRSIVLDTYGHVTGLSYSSFLISDLGGTAISSPSNGQVLSYNGTNWVNSSLSGLSIITGSGTTNWVPKFTSASAIGLSNIYDNGTFVGINTSTDNLSGAKLQVSGAALFSGNITINASATSGLFLTSTSGSESPNVTFVSSTNQYNIDNSGGNLRFFTEDVGGGNGVVRATLSSSGNLGLGVTPSAWGSGYTALQIENTGFMADADRIWMYANGYFNGTSNLYIQNGFASRYYQASGQHIWDTAPSGTAGNAITFTQAMTLDASGMLRVLMKNDPLTGAVTAKFVSFENNPYGLIFRGYASGTHSIQSQRENNDAQPYALSLQPLGGRVLIGTTTDNTVDLLQVAGSVKSTGNIVSNGGSFFTNDNGRYGWGAGSTYMDGDAANGYVRFFTAGSERMRITSGGEVYIAGTTDQGAYNLQCNGTGVWGAGAYVNGSDIRLKENISPIKTALEYVNKMNPISFKYKESYSKDQNIQPGFIAQELKELFKDEIWVNGIVSEGTDYLNVAYQNIIPLLTKAIQEQQIQIENLKSKLN